MMFSRDPLPGSWQQCGMAKLTARQLKTSLQRVPQWTKKSKTIQRTFVFKDFPAAIKFVDAVARRAEKAWHHPDIDIRWNKVRLVLTTHDSGGLTAKDFKLAAVFDQLSS